MDNPDYSHLDFRFIYRASSLGGCLKAMAALQLGYTPVETPEFFAGIFKEGRLHEDSIINDLIESGYQVYDRELQVVFPVTKEIAVVGHIDGKLIELAGKHRLLEMKTMSADAYKEFANKGWDTPGLIQKYKWQVSTYMWATELPLTLIAKNRNNGRIMDLSASEPFYTKGQIMARVLKAHSYVTTGELPDDCEGGFPCPVPYLHAEPQPAQSKAEDTDGQAPEAVLELVADLRAARAMEAAAKAKARVVKEQLIQAMGGENKYDGVVTKFEKAGPTTVDWEKMREDGVEVEKYQKKGKKYWEVRLAKVEEGKGDDEAK